MNIAGETIKMNINDHYYCLTLVHSFTMTKGCVNTQHLIQEIRCMAEKVI